MSAEPQTFFGYVVRTGPPGTQIMDPTGKVVLGVIRPRQAYYSDRTREIFLTPELFAEISVAFRCSDDGVV